MMGRLGEKIGATLRHLAPSLCRVQVSAPVCVSISGRNAVRLPGLLLASADQLQIVFSVRWRWPASPRRRILDVRLRRDKSCDTHAVAPELAPLAGQGDDFGAFAGHGVWDAPRKPRWWRRVFGTPLHIAEVLRAPHPAKGHPAVVCRLEQIIHWRTAAIRLTLPGNLIRGQQEIGLELTEDNGAVLLAAIPLRVLDVIGTRSMLLDQLQAQGRRLWVRGGARCHLADLIPRTSEFLFPEFTLPPNKLGPFVRPFKAVLTLSLASEKGRVRLSRRILTITGDRAPVRGPPLALNDAALFPRPGDYRLVASLAGREIASFPFRLVDQAEIVRRLRVRRIHIDAETCEGRMVCGLGRLHWKEHRAIRASFQLETEVPAPNTLADCVVRIVHGSQELRREAFLIPLDRVTRRVKLQRISLPAPGWPARSKPVRLTFSVSIGGEQKCELQVMVLPPERITNFEGQLNLDVKDLALDEAEYETILRGLNGLRSQNSRRPIWRKAA